MIPQLAQEYLLTRPNKDTPHPKLVVLFLACSGSGKSTIRQHIVSALKATYFCNDEARELLTAAGLDSYPKAVIDDTWKLWQIQASNQFIVFDSNMSSSYMNADSYYNIALRDGYQTFIIAIDLTEKELISRVNRRNRNDTANILELLPQQLDAYHKAATNLKPDFTITAQTACYEDVTELIRSKLEAIRS